MILMFFLNVLLTCLTIICYPVLLWMLPRKERKERLGFHTPKLHQSIWIHAASVGEVNACRSLITEIRERHPHHAIILTTTTHAGKKTAETIDATIYTHILPLDVPFVIEPFIRRIDPQLLILIETELWPNMILALKRRGVPILCINARLSPRSFPKYKRMEAFLRVIQPAFKAVNAQSEADVARFEALGFTNVHNALNLKFASRLPQFDRSTLRSRWGFEPEDFVLVFGSSRPGEELLLKDMYTSLAQIIPFFKLIVVPRHLNRIPEVENIFTGMDYSLSSSENRHAPIRIVDTMGILVEAYALADLAIVGGSFFDFGGHNPLEPAFYGLPILMGPYYASCADSVAKLKEDHAIMITEATTLEETVRLLYHDGELRNAMGLQAKNVMHKYSESLDINLSTIEAWIERERRS